MDKHSPAFVFFSIFSFISRFSFFLRTRFSDSLLSQFKNHSKLLLNSSQIITKITLLESTLNYARYGAQIFRFRHWPKTRVFTLLAAGDCSRQKMPKPSLHRTTTIMWKINHSCSQIILPGFNHLIIYFGGDLIIYFGLLLQPWSGWIWAYMLGFLVSAAVEKRKKMMASISIDVGFVIFFLFFFSFFVIFFFSFYLNRVWFVLCSTPLFPFALWLGIW